MKKILSAFISTAAAILFPDMAAAQENSVLLPDGTYLKERDLDQWAPESGADGPEIREQILKWLQWSYYHLRYKDIT